MEWFNEPSRWSERDGTIIIRADARTDFWRITDYGYVRDNGHIYGEAITTDFDLTVRVDADYADQYDQAGVAIRVDESHWLKTGVERYEGKLRFSTVITVDHSNWVIADLPERFRTLNLHLTRRNDVVHIGYSVDDATPEMASVVYLEPGASAFVGLLCAAPEGEGFEARFSDLVISRR
jgi:regulation of enolase protein 1 (concanavalin A-like superfamily)